MTIVIRLTINRSGFPEEKLQEWAKDNELREITSSFVPYRAFVFQDDSIATAFKLKFMEFRYIPPKEYGTTSSN